MLFTAVPVGVCWIIPPLPSTPSTVIVQSFAGLVPPKSVPAINKVSFVTNPEPKPVVVAEYTVPVLVTVKVAPAPEALAV